MQRLTHRLAAPLLLGSLYLLVIWLVPPWYEVPQNDDWAYLLTLRQWFDSGRLVHLGWNDPTLIFQLLWGALFAKLLGLGYTSLRLSTLVLSWIGVLSLYGVLRELGAARAAALLGAGVLLLNPIYLTLSYSFNTDVPYVALATAATWVFLRARTGKNDAGLLASGILMACAFLVRQQALALVVVATAFLLWSAWPGRRKLRASLLLIAPVLLAIVVHAVWLRQTTGGGWAAGLLPMSSRPVGRSFFDLLEQAAREGLGTTLTLGLLGAALTLAGLGSGLGRMQRHRALLIGSAAAFLLLVAASVWLMQGQSDYLRGWPYQGNYLTRVGTLAGSARVLAPQWTWWGLTLATPVLAAWLVTAVVWVLGNARRDSAARGTAMVVVAGLAQLAPALLLETVYDRYLLVALPATAAALTAWAMPIGRRGVLAGLVLSLLCGGISIEWTRAYVDRSRARWEVAQELVQQGVSPAQIAAGFEWQGHHLYLEARRTLGVRPPYDLEQGYPWDPLVNPTYFIVESDRDAGAPLPQRTFRAFFSGTPRYVAAFRR